MSTATYVPIMGSTQSPAPTWLGAIWRCPGRTLLHELFATAGDIKVSDSELQITLAPLSSPHRTHAAQALCEMLDQTATIFPGSRLRIRFAVRPPPRVGLAFPGSPVERSTATAVAPVP